MGGDRRGVRLVEQRARDHLPQASTISRATGAPRSPCSRWCSATSATIARPASRSRAIPPPARRESTASSWSMRRARTSSRASARPIRSARSRPAEAEREGMSEQSAATSRYRSKRTFPKVYGELLKISKASRTTSATAGHGVHHRARQAVHAADPQRQAHGRGRGARSRVDMADEKLIDKRTALMRVDPVQARAAAASAPRSEVQENRHRARAAGLARRGLRRGGVLRR